MTMTALFRPPFTLSTLCATAAMITLLAIGAVRPATAAACYTDAQLEAEQAIRVHSELMVIALKCYRHFPESKPYEQYASFTERNRSLISRWETTLVQFFRNEHRARPTRAFDSLRTRIANDFAAEANVMTADRYCSQKLEHLKQVTLLDEQGFALMVGKLRETVLSSVPHCSTATEAYANRDGVTVEVAER